MAFDMQENNKVGFDMTKIKVGDKLIQRNGAVVELAHVWDYETPYKYQLSNGDSLTKDGYFWKEWGESEYDVIGFADENQQASKLHFYRNASR